MWYEIAPAFLIIATVMGAPHGIAYVLNWLVDGYCYRRKLIDYEQRLQYLRDIRLTGCAYKMTDLDNIPDDEECEKDENNKFPDDEECEKEENHKFPDADDEECERDENNANHQSEEECNE